MKIISSFLKNTIQILQALNQQGCYQEIYNQALTTTKNIYKAETEDLLSGTLSNFSVNLTKPSPLKTFHSEVWMPDNCFADWSSTPGWYFIAPCQEEQESLPVSYETSLPQKEVTSIVKSTIKEERQIIKQDPTQIKGKKLLTNCTNSVEKLKKACQTIESDFGIKLELNLNRKRITRPFMEKVVEQINLDYDAPTAMYLECRLGVRLIYVHLKRDYISNGPAVIMTSNNGYKKYDGNSIHFMMNEVYSKNGIDYTQSALKQHNHPFVMFVDHYHVAPSLLEGVVESAENNIQYRNLYNSPNKALVTHRALTIEEFLYNPEFEIVKRQDPRTISGSFHTLLKTLTPINKMWTPPVREEYKTTPRLK